jgi:hypothetical protein
MAASRRLLRAETSEAPTRNRSVRTGRCRSSRCRPQAPALGIAPEEPSDLAEPTAATVGTGSGLSSGEPRCDPKGVDRNEGPAAVERIASRKQDEPVARHVRPARNIPQLPEVTLSVERKRRRCDPPQRLAEIKELLHRPSASQAVIHAEVTAG